MTKPKWALDMDLETIKGGNSIQAARVLGRIKVNLSVGDTLSETERGYLLWALERVDEDVSDPFGLNNPVDKEEWFPPTESDREYMILQTVESQKLSAKSKGNDISVEQAVTLAMLTLRESGINHAESYVLKQFYKAQRKWRLASAVVEVLAEKGNDLSIKEACHYVLEHHGEVANLHDISEVETAYKCFHAHILEAHQ